MDSITTKDAEFHLGEKLEGLAALVARRLRKQIVLLLAHSKDIGGETPHAQVIVQLKYG